MIISPFSNTRIYFAAQRLFRSDDRGDDWKAVSGDLTRQVDRNRLKMMGRVWGPRRRREEHVDVVLRKHRLAGRVAEEGRAPLRRDRRRPRAGDRGRRRELAEGGDLPRRAGERVRLPSRAVAARRGDGLRGVRQPQDGGLQAVPAQEHGPREDAGRRSPETSRRAGRSTRSPRTRRRPASSSAGRSSGSSSRPTAGSSGSSSRAGCRRSPSATSRSRSAKGTSSSRRSGGASSSSTT